MNIINFQILVAYHNTILFLTYTVPCGLGGPFPSGSRDLWNMWPQPLKRGMEEVDSTYVTTAHGPLAGPRQLQERVRNVGEHMGYFVSNLE